MENEAKELKRQLEFWKIENDLLISENAYLKNCNEEAQAKVERLTFDPMSYLDDQGEWMPRHTHLAAVERLKAELEEARRGSGAGMKAMLGLSDDLVEENTRLKAEVERLKGIILAQSSDFVQSKTSDDGIKPDGHNDLAGRAVEHCLKLQAEVERLRKAGDAMVELLVQMDVVMDMDSDHPEVDAWNEAKEGKQS